jgi:hypothetical protein
MSSNSAALFFFYICPNEDALIFQTTSPTKRQALHLDTSRHIQPICPLRTQTSLACNETNPTGRHTPQSYSTYSPAVRYEVKTAVTMKNTPPISLYVYSLIIARQRLGTKNPLIVARQRLGKNPIVARPSVIRHCGPRICKLSSGANMLEASAERTLRIPFLAYFPYFQKKSRLMRSRCCVCVCLRIYPLIVGRQRLGRNDTAVTNTHATQELLDASFSMWPVSYEGK